MTSSNEPIRWRNGPVSTTDLVRYAGVSGDFNRIHFDHPFATEAGLKGLLVHGMLTMGFAASCAQRAVGNGAYIRDISARFVAPVWAGEVVDVEATPADDDEGVAYEIVARVGDRIVLQGRALAIPHPGATA